MYIHVNIYIYIYIYILACEASGAARPAKRPRRPTPDAALH